MGYEIPTPRSPMSARAFRVLSGLTNNLNQTVRQIHEGWVRDTADLAPVIKAIQAEIEDLRTRFAEGLSSTHDEPLDLAEEAQAVRRRGGRAPVDQLAQIQAVVEILENASKKGGV